MKEQGEVGDPIEERLSGRTPRSADSVDRLLSAARDLFFSRGVDAVSTDMLATAASMSKTTMYKLFPDKRAIFEAVIRREALIFRRYLEKVENREAPVREAIRDFGCGLVDLLQDPQVARFEQLIIGQSAEHPDIARTFFNEAHTVVVTALAHLIERAQQSGDTSSLVPARKLAGHLYKLWEGHAHSARQLGLPEGQIDNVRAHVDECINIVLGPQDG